MSLIVISFDGVSDTEFKKMAALPEKYPNIASFKTDAIYHSSVSTTFVSNTYPIHTSIITGNFPSEHGIISNTVSIKNNADIWAQEAERIKSKTIFQAAYEKGLKVGAISWPVTCGAKIKWNMPEVHIRPGQNRIIQHMRHGSIFFQLNMMRKFGHKLDGLAVPQLDDFLSAAASDLLRSKKPDLLLVHLLSYDTMRHKTGLAPQLDIARASLDESLGRLLEAAPKDAGIIIFSDHAHLDVIHNVNLAEIYGKKLYEQCGGCAFFTQPIDGIEAQPWFGRFLRQDEMENSGYEKLASYGVAAKMGYSLGRGEYAANHGYPTDYPNYQVFFAHKNMQCNVDDLPHRDIRDVHTLIVRELNLNIRT